VKVDLTGPLFDALEKSKKDFRVETGAGNTEGAKKKARDCAALLHQLAKNSPEQRQGYLEKALHWERISEGEISPPRRQKAVPGKVTSAKTHAAVSGDLEEEILEKAEGMISVSPVRWSDIGGLDTVKRLMMETVVIAGLQKPESIRPWKGVLLFGPPGTGKTLIAAAAAGSLNATFYDVKADRILSKYFGESSKLISGLYESARRHSPAIVFMDEFDSLTQARGENTGEATRKVLSTILTELDGLQDKKSVDLLLTLAATNTPWDLDNAVLSRFPRRVYVTLPDKKACGDIIRIQMEGLDISRLKLDVIAGECVSGRYSGRDIVNVCQQATWNMINEENRDLHLLADLPFDELKKRCLKVRPLMRSDFTGALEKIRSPVTEDDLEHYEQWNSEYGES